MMIELPIEIRFWNKVNKTDTCWLFTGYKNKKGYGKFKVNKQILAHRFSYELHYGPIPKGMYVCHKCDNPPCIRPDHLFLGTQKDNMDDMLLKGRNNPKFGEDNAASKLTDANVRFIRSYPIYRGSQTELAKQFNVSQELISKIVNNKNWKHIINL